MKYCPYCGAVLVNGAVSFCAECGKALPETEKKEEIHEPPNPPKQKTESLGARRPVPKDAYDGYYDDIVPIDEGRFSEGIDRHGSVDCRGVRCDDVSAMNLIEIILVM